MPALAPGVAGATDDAGASWALPDWEEFSEAAKSSFVGDWSDVEADASLDTASSVASTEHQRVYRIQRARGGFPEEKRRDLTDLHSLYTRRRLEEKSQGFSSVRSSANWLQPAPCSSPRVVEEKPVTLVSKKEENQVESELLAQQSEISAEIQAVRKQLSDFQDKWKKSMETGDSGIAVKQWLQLLTQKLELQAKNFSHGPTQNFHSDMIHLAVVWGLNNGAKTVDQHEQRQITNFDRAVQQLQGYHHERMHQVVNESIAELNLVRGRYKKKEAKLEAELRAANKEIEKWKQSSAEAEHRNTLDRKALEFQFSSVKEQHAHEKRRYEEDIAQLRDQLETARAERKQVVSQHRDTHEVIAQAKEGAVVLERQCQALKKQQERAKELHDREVRVLQDTIRQLRDSNDELEARYLKDKQALIDATNRLESEKKELEARVKGDIEQQVMHDLLPEKLAELEMQHKKAMDALETEHKRQLADKFDVAVCRSVHSIETQTDPPTEEIIQSKRVAQDGDNEAQAQIEGLTRRCQALEKLLDKKFEETPQSLSASRRCESCYSDDGISTNSVRHDLNTSRSSLLSDSSFRSRASGKSRALARVLLGSSSASLHDLPAENKAPPFMNETTLATDEATLGAHEMWDSASFTSIDT
eukprot:jgi/Phyca11/54995/gw1.6.159.1